MLNTLSREERMRLMKFVCSFAWADLEVQDQERTLVANMIKRLELDDEDKKKVEAWLEVPPPPEQVDPALIPPKHRQIFLETMQEVIDADDVVDPDEKENFELFKQLLS